MSTVLNNVSLLPFNTFGIKANAKYFTEFGSTAALIDILKDPQWSNIKKMILGGGSNILLTHDFDGLVLKNSMRGIEITKEDPDYFYVKASAGEQWHDFVLYCLHHQMGGVENLSLIPGSVGASPMQNIGAYGVELCDVFDSLEAIHISSLEQKIFTKAECHFGYRESVFKRSLKDQYIILSVTYRLSKEHVIHNSYGAISEVLRQKHIEKPTIQDISNAVIEIRQSKLPDPKQLGNAGSFFKNPEIEEWAFKQFHLLHPAAPFFKTSNGQYKIPAGWLIEQCGWKGKVIGNTGAHKDQALVLVNYGHATGEEIWTLALKIQHSVKEKFDIDIHTEVNIH